MGRPFERVQELASQGLETLDESFRLVALARAKADELIGQWTDLAGTSNSDAATGAVAKYRRMVTALDAAKIWGETGRDVFDAYLDEIGGRGSKGAPGTVVVETRPDTAAPDALHQELAGSDDDDREMRRRTRFARGLVHNAGDMQEQAKSWADGVPKTRPPVEPPPAGETYATVVHPASPQMVAPGHQDVAPADVVSQGLVIVVAVGSLITQQRRRRKADRKEKHG